MSVSSLLAELRRRDIRLRSEAGALQYDAPEHAMTNDLRERIVHHRDELLEMLGRAHAAPATTKITRVGSNADVPLSFGQERLWFLDQMGAGSAYNIRLALHLRGSLDRDALEAAVNAIVARHGALRTTYPSVAGHPRQVVRPALHVPLDVIDLRQTPDRDAEVQRLIVERVGRPFDLAQGPLLSATLMHVGPDAHVFLIAMHHIACDGWSLGIVRRELGAFYRHFRDGVPAALPERPLQCADYAAWQRAYLQGPTLERLLSYWTSVLGDERPELALPTDRPRSATPSRQGAWHDFAIPVSLVDAARTVNSACGTTMAMLFQAAYTTLLFRCTGQTDVLIGSPVANREERDLEHVVGFLVNMLALRTDHAGDPTFTELLGRVRQASIDAYQHQALPFERLVEAVQPERAAGTNPLFEVAFAMQTAPQPPVELSGLTVRDLASRAAGARFDLELHIHDDGPDGLRGRLVYRPEQFDDATIERMGEQYLRLLEAAVTAPDTRLSRLPLLDADERERILVAWNRTASDYPRDASVHELVAAQAARTPDAVAVAYGDAQLSYAALDDRASRLASYLITHGVGPDVRVGLAVPPCVDMVVGMLAILRAGGVYVPLDPDYPPSRLAYMLEETGAPVVITQQDVVPRLPAHAGVTVRLDADWSVIADTPAAPPPRTTGASPAYVIYTSGSTGRPKGVCVPHRAITRLVLGTDFVQLDANDRVAQAANVSFDATTFEVWGALLNGGTVIGLGPDVTLDPARFAAAIRERGITVLFITTALFNQLAVEVPGIFAPLRCLLFGGEAVDPARVRAVLEHEPPQRLLHVYGPTENTTFSTWHDVRTVPADARTVPIGRPVHNSTAYVLDESGEPAPIGAPGELYVGGDGLALGYFADATLTGDRFVPHPFVPGERLYKTGDLVRWRADGAIEFIGRRDHQVKIRGFRIEIGEIESELLAVPGVRDAVVLCREDTPGEKQLVAYVVPAAGETLSRDDVRAALRERLPEYMCPSFVVPLDAMPLNRNGKIDRAALPAPDTGAAATGDHVAPRTGTERTLATIWADVLRIDRVGVHDNFFYDLGGHSLVATRVVGRVRERFGVDLPLAAIFDHPTIAELAGLLDQEEREEIEL